MSEDEFDVALKDVTSSGILPQDLDAGNAIHNSYVHWQLLQCIFSSLFWLINIGSTLELTDFSN